MTREDGTPIEFYEVVLQRGAPVQRAAPRGTPEHLTVRSGRVRVEVGEESAELRSGDSIVYAADVGRAIVNVGRAPAVVYLIEPVP
jgi:quercetin dioxygenase-like cupin family protein